ncbi:hypothetical protein [Streptomyces scabichelini]|uniref:hypothetical protein n=1 Tax=Streptomyces scabichelini TaxID=2711217 RepID=UPI001F498B85|nr:hypothetical protein [Streptomyces scabichelini]
MAALLGAITAPTATLAGLPVLITHAPAAYGTGTGLAVTGLRARRRRSGRWAPPGAWE